MDDATESALSTLLALTPEQRAQVLAELPEHTAEIEHWRTLVSDMEEQLHSAIDAHAKVLAELPETKPTAWQRLCHFLANGYDGHETRVRVECYRPANGRQHRVFLATNARNTDWGEGHTLDAALANAMEKIP